MFGCFGRVPHGRQPTFKIFCRANDGACLTVRGGTLGFDAADPDDERQHWTKDVRFSRVVKDEEGNPVFSLVNKATGLAIQHSLGPGHPVRLAKFKPDYFDESMMWTESADLCKDFGCIRMMHNVALSMVTDFTSCSILLSNQADIHGDLKSWKIVPWFNGASFDELGSLPTSRIYCKAVEGLSVTIRDGAVCLAPTDPHDKCQHWIEDKRPGHIIKDEEGYPAFVLVSKATGEAIADSGGNCCPLKLKPYNPNYLDASVLWTKSFDMANGFRHIHTVDDLSLHFNAFGRLCDGTSIVLSPWSKDDNLQWKIDYWKTVTELH